MQYEFDSRIHYSKFVYALLAQLVEQRIRNAWVVGSIPTSGSIFMGGACRGGIAGYMPR